MWIKEYLEQVSSEEIFTHCLRNRYFLDKMKEVIKNKLGFKPSPLGAAMLFAALSGTLTHNPSLYKKQ